MEQIKKHLVKFPPPWPVLLAHCFLTIHCTAQRALPAESQWMPKEPLRETISDTLHLRCAAAWRRRFRMRQHIWLDAFKRKRSPGNKKLRTKGPNQTEAKQSLLKGNKKNPLCLPLKSSFFIGVTDCVWELRQTLETQTNSLSLHNVVSHLHLLDVLNLLQSQRKLFNPKAVWGSGDNVYFKFCNM